MRRLRRQIIRLAQLRPTKWQLILLIMTVVFSLIIFSLIFLRENNLLIFHSAG